MEGDAYVAAIPGPAELATPDGWQRALEIRFHARAAQWWTVAADVSIQMAQHLASRRDYRRALEILDEVRVGKVYDADAQSAAAVHVGAIYANSGRSREGRALIAGAIGHLGESREEIYCYGLTRMGISFLTDGDPESAIEWFKLAEVAAAGDQFTLAQIRDELAMAEYARGNIERARSLHLQALGTFRALGVPVAAMICLFALARLEARQDQFRLAAKYALEAAETAEANGMYTHAADGYSKAGEFASRGGEEVELSIGLFQRSLSIGENLDEGVFDSSPAHYGLGILYGSKSAFAAAAYHVSQLIELTDDAGAKGSFQNWRDGLIQLRDGGLRASSPESSEESQ